MYRTRGGRRHGVARHPPPVPGPGAERVVRRATSSRGGRVACVGRARPGPEGGEGRACPTTPRSSDLGVPRLAIRVGGRTDSARASARTTSRCSTRELNGGRPILRHAHCTRPCAESAPVRRRAWPRALDPHRLYEMCAKQMSAETQAVGAHLNTSGTRSTAAAPTGATYTRLTSQLRPHCAQEVTHRAGQLVASHIRRTQAATFSGSPRASRSAHTWISGGLCRRHFSGSANAPALLNRRTLCGIQSVRILAGARGDLLLERRGVGGGLGAVV
eukprot:scaffold2979_cov405-Prasinococcus_capsulatus_cf.AAC.9